MDSDEDVILSAWFMSMNEYLDFLQEECLYNSLPSLETVDSDRSSSALSVDSGIEENNDITLMYYCYSTNKFYSYY